jgi:FkbM family methyltransferase
MDLSLWLLRIRKLAAVLQSPRLRRAFTRHRVLAAVEHGFVLRRGFATVFDVGANKGQFALAARAVLPRALIVSFEPLDGPLRTLGAVFEGDSAFRVHQTCLGSEAGEAEFNVSKHDDSSSLLEISELQTSTFPGTEVQRKERVQVQRLDGFLSTSSAIEGPALLKIDVQGFELEVLKGCGSELRQFDVVYCECSFMQLYEQQAVAAEVIAFLAARGYPLKGLYNPAYDTTGRCIQADLLFERS